MDTIREEVVKMDFNKLYKQNKIEKKILELENRKQELYKQGLENEDNYNEYIKLDDEIEELTMSF